MTGNPNNRKRFQPQEPVIRWLLDSDPSIRWQVMRDLTGAPTEEVAAERAAFPQKVTVSGCSDFRHPTDPGAE
ncbi:MAG: hypothetical protein R3F07_15095 [Opitutaceae bacterium]